MDATGLYHGPLEDFVSRRTALVRDTRAADPSAATAMGKLRKPPVPVWAIDQLATENPALVVELLAAAADARDVQRAVADQMETREDLARASGRLRECVEAAARAAEQVLEQAGTAGSEGLGRRIRSTLQSAATGTADDRMALWRGTLDHEVTPSGFGSAETPDVDGPELTAVLTPLRRGEAKQRSGALHSRTRADGDVTARAALERAAAKHDDAAARARALATAKRRHAETLAEELQRAEEDADAAEQAAGNAEAEARVARAALDR